jgi:hypothetical protein
VLDAFWVILVVCVDSLQQRPQEDTYQYPDVNRTQADTAAHARDSKVAEIKQATLALMIIRAVGWMFERHFSSFEVMGSALLCLHISIDPWYGSVCNY